MRRAGMVVSGLLLTFAVAGQIALCVLFFRDDGNDVVRNLGWAVMCLSALFGWLPIITFKRLGGVPKHRSYMETTVLVDRGVYAVVRHPQYLAGILLAVAFSLIAQHWSVPVVGAVVAALSYAGTYPEEDRLRDKFGLAYDQYARRVPRVNFVWGLARAIKRRSERG